jgi:hypothetical protein
MGLLRAATTEQPVDPKHLGDAILLGQLMNTEVGSWPSAVLCKEKYLTNPTARCARCDASASSIFPLAPKQRIVDILGYC